MDARLSGQTTPKLAKKTRFESHSSLRKPVAVVRPTLQINPAHQAMDTGLEPISPPTETNREMLWSTRTPPPRDREPYQPLCEPITPEPANQRRQSPRTNYGALDYQALISNVDGKTMEILDVLVILSKEYGGMSRNQIT